MLTTIFSVLTFRIYIVAHIVGVWIYFVICLHIMLVSSNNNNTKIKSNALFVLYNLHMHMHRIVSKESLLQAFTGRWHLALMIYQLLLIIHEVKHLASSFTMYSSHAPYLLPLNIVY